MKEILYIKNISRKPILQASSKLIAELFTVSRLNYKPDFIAIKNECPLPLFPSNFDQSYESIALSRAEGLWKTSENINLLWSGGIDSTCALVALMMTKPLHGKIVVYCNLNSIIENRELYQILLTHSYISLKNSSFISSTEVTELVTGELGDQIFGSDLLFSIGQLFGLEKNFSPYEEIIPKLFIKRSGEEFGFQLYEKYRPIVNECPFKIKTAFDFIWWWNFTQKWQCVKYRQAGLMEDNIKLTHFFESDEFQEWSLFNHHLKIGETVESYKMPAKDFIFSFDKNALYQKNKKKRASPIGNKIHFYGLFTDGSKLKTYDECSSYIEANTPHILY